MMTSEERITKLRQMGYSDREAAFLLIAALHSGAFVMRQYAAYAGVKPGGSTDQFVSKSHQSATYPRLPQQEPLVDLSNLQTCF
jgi:hypothetical protein